MTKEQVEKLVALRLEGLTWKEISREFPNHSPNALRKAFYRNIRDNREVAPVKILCFDIETAPMEVYVWGLFDQHIGMDQIIKDWSILSWSAKWVGAPDSQVMYADNRGQKDVRNDRKLLQQIWKLLDEADIVLTQNGKKFDVKKLNARFILAGMIPPSSFRHIDTLQIAKRHFAFTSNKLAYMTGNLCTKYQKLSHSKFPGIALWKECLAGNLEAWMEMEEYNKVDVLSLEELYTDHLRAWDKSINFNVYTDRYDHVCSCGSTDFARKGFHFTNNGKFRRYKCKECGAESVDKENLLTKEKRKSLRK